MRVSAQCVSQRSRYACASSSALEAQPAQRRLLRVPDAGFDFPFAIGIADATRQRDHAVMGEHVAVQRIERRVVDVRGEDAFLEIVEDDDADGAAQAAKRALVQLGPHLRARVPHQKPDRFARVAERQDKEARAPVLAGLRMPDHRAVAVIDLAFLAGRRGDHDARLGRGRCPGASARSAGRSHTARRSRGRRPGPARSPSRSGRARAPRRSALDTARTRSHWAHGPGAGPWRSRWTPPPWWPDLAAPESVDTCPEMAGFDRPESVDTSTEIAGFDLASLGRPRLRTAMPAAFRYPLIVSRRMPVASSMRESVQPRRPSARICCCFSSSKTLLMPATEPAFCARVNVSAASVNCRF